MSNSVSMNSVRISCAAVAIVLSATSCIEWETAERRRAPQTPAEGPTVAGSPPGDAIAGRASGARAEGSADRARGRPGGGPAFAGAYGTRQPADVWVAVRDRMTVVPVIAEVSSLREFRRKLLRYHGNQRFFDAISDRARPWLFHVLRELAERGMPGELALLPAVESGYNPGALSSQNAAGLWQILPATAHDLDLAQSWWYDARYDPLAATNAALDYLSTLRTTFNDDWLLAVAAYNCGPGNLRRAIVRAGRKLETATYAAIERYLPNETRGHMARWLVISEIVAIPRLHNIRMKPIPLRPYFTAVSASSQVDLALAARNAGVPAAEISMLNLGFTRGMTAPSGPHRLLVPSEHAARFERGLADLRPSLPTGGKRYRIRKGDTLDAIARAHNTTVRGLMAANGLNSHLIRAGRELTIPGAHAAVADTSFDRSAVHVVSPGESLWFIARQYRTTVNSLRDWNRIAPGSSLLRPGQELRVRGEG